MGRAYRVGAFEFAEEEAGVGGGDAEGFVEQGSEVGFGGCFGGGGGRGLDGGRH